MQQYFFMAARGEAQRVAPRSGYDEAADAPRRRLLHGRRRAREGSLAVSPRRFRKDCDTASGGAAEPTRERHAL
jgi:hypothetical protein